MVLIVLGLVQVREYEYYFTNNTLNSVIDLLNDLWRYRMNDSTWTWISGSNKALEKGVYGEKGIASTTNIPGARTAPVGWFNSVRQELWLFGGSGYDYRNSSQDSMRVVSLLFTQH